MKKINNYRWQQQQQSKQEYYKVKKIKEKAKKMPVSASEEIEYMKKLLNGEDVGNFKDEPEPMPEIQWNETLAMHYFSSRGVLFGSSGKTRT
jgi:hypothetical protein